VALDAVSVALPYLIHQPGQLAVGDVLAPAAAGTDQVVVVFGWVAQDVRMGPGRQVQPFHDMQRDQQIQRPEDGRPADVDPFAASPLEHVRGREMTAGSRNQIGHQAPIRRCLVTCAFERLNDAFGLVHVILSLTAKAG